MDRPIPAVDLRSDTVTHPTEAMWERMRGSPLGDDGLDGDPTVRRLEEATAELLAKEAGLFVPSCTMANLLAILAQVGRQEQVALGGTSHIYTSESGSATFTGAFYLGLPGTAGTLDLDALDVALEGGGHKLRTALVALETSHNNAGGAVPSLDHMDDVRRMASEAGAAVHVDGARLFNAAVALGVPASRIAEAADTVSLCLSKGLSAPMGAVLVGPRETIDRCRKLRRMLGGTLRQAGVVAAAGVEGILSMPARLADDHRRAADLSAGIAGLGSALGPTTPQTNIVQVDVSRTGRDAAAWTRDLGELGILVRPWGRGRLRCVTHRHIDDAAIRSAVDGFARVLGADA